MAGAALPGAQTVRGQLLTDDEANTRKHLEVQATLASSRCIACTRSEGTTCFYSQAGRTEYDRTGVCESCWDCMFDPGNGRQEQLQQCQKLSTTGVEQVIHWILVAKARNTLTVSQQDYVWITDANADRRTFGNPFVWWCQHAISLPSGLPVRAASKQSMDFLARDVEFVAWRRKVCLRQCELRTAWDSIVAEEKIIWVSVLSEWMWWNLIAVKKPTDWALGNTRLIYKVRCLDKNDLLLHRWCLHRMRNAMARVPLRAVCL